MTDRMPLSADDDRAKMMTWEHTRSVLIELGERLDPHHPVELVIAGGATMTSAGLRQMTADVDVVSEIPADVLSAATSVADDRDLSPSWLNANARSFLPTDAHARESSPRGGRRDSRVQAAFVPRSRRRPPLHHRRHHLIALSPRRSNQDSNQEIGRERTESAGGGGDRTL